MAYNTRGYGMTTYMATGDPFLGGILKGAGKFLGGVAKTVGSIAPGPVGGILSTVGGIIAPPKVVKASALPRPFSVQGGLPGLPGAPTLGFNFPAVPGGGAMIPSSGAGMQKPSGYHLNKSGYFLKNGQYIAPGTKWVRNRRTNPANGRALRRAVRRTKSFNNLVKRSRKELRALSRI